MRIEQLEVSGLRSHRGNPPTFLELADKRLVAIVGHTGAGKSSLLEAVTFALFGDATYGGKAYEELSSDGRSEMSVRMVFTVGDGRYQLVRSVRPDRNGDFKSKQIYLRQVDADGEPLTHLDGVRRVDDAVSKLLGGITREQFCQAVLLAQNRFAAFLEADPRERDALLDTLLGLTALVDARKALQSTQKAAQRNIDRLTDRRNSLPEDPQAAAREAKKRSDAMTGIAAQATEGAERLGTLSLEAAVLTKESEELTGVVAMRATSTGADGLSRLAQMSAILTELAQLDEALRKRERDTSNAIDVASATLKEATETLGTAEVQHGRLGQHVVVAEQLRQLSELLAMMPGRQRDVQDAEQTLVECRNRVDQAQFTVSSAEAAAHDGRQVLTAAKTWAAAKRSELSDAEQALSAVDGLVSRLRAQVDLAVRCGAELAEADIDVANAEVDQEAATTRRAEAQRDFEIAQRTESAAAAAHGCEPGDDCPICLRPLPDDWISPQSGDLDAATARAREAESALEETHRKLSKAREGRVAATTGLESSLAGVAAAWGDLDMAAGRAGFPQPPQAPVALEPKDETSSAFGAAVVGAQTLGQRVAAWAASIVALLLPLRDECLQADDAAKRAAEASDAADKVSAEANRALNAASADLAGAGATHDRCAAELDAAKTQLASTLGAVQQPWRDVVDLESPESLERAANQLGEDKAAVESAAEARAAAASAAAIAESEMQALVNERSQSVTAPLAAASTTLTDLGALVNELATRVDVPPTAPSAASSDPVALLEAATSLQATAVTAVDAATARINAIRAQIDGLVRPAAEVVRSLVEIISVADPTGTDIGDPPDLEDPLGTDTYARVQQIVGAAGRLAAESRAAGAKAKEDVKTAREFGKRLEALAAWRADLFGAIEVLKKESFPSWARNVRIADLVETASDVFSEMSSGRYRFDEALRISDGQAGAVRNASSLSGGEKFEAALALALGVAEIAGRSGVRIDTLFLDEGFAGLDQAHLNRTIDALESQVEAGRCIVLITHIGSVADRIQDVLLVQPDGVGGSNMRWLNEEERYELGADLDLAVP